MDHICPFEPLEVLGIALDDPDEERECAAWIVVFDNHGEETLYYRTNVMALAAQLNSMVAPGVARALKRYDGSHLAAVNATHEDAEHAVEAAVILTAEMLN